MDLRYKTYSADIKADGGDTRTMHFLISTDAVDRDNDILDPKGWELDRYKANPVIQFAHDYKSLPVAKCISIGQTAKGLEATAEFPPKGTYAFADTVYDMLKGGFLNATSVGFRPIDFEQAKDRKGYNFTKQELTEFSIVPIPSNPEALVQQRSATQPEHVRSWCKAITEWAEKQIETPAQLRVKALLPDKKPWVSNAKAWGDLEKDYEIEAEAKEPTVARVAKLLSLHGFTEEATALTKDDAGLDTQAALLKSKVLGYAMDAYANAHHAECVMGELCNAGDMNHQAQGKALSGSHMAKAKEAHGAIGRAKAHALSAAKAVNGDDDATDKALADSIAKAKAEAEKKADSDCFIKLIEDPNTVSIKDTDLTDVLASLGPEFAEAIAGQSRDALNRILGRLD